MTTEVPAATRTARPKSDASHARACDALVGGVNSPVRAFGSVGGTPGTVARAAGARIEDVDGHDALRIRQLALEIPQSSVDIAERGNNTKD